MGRKAKREEAQIRKHLAARKRNLGAQNHALAEQLARADEEIERLGNERARLSAGLTALHMAPKTVGSSVLRSVAYDIAFNCIDGETAEFQIKRRAGIIDEQSTQCPDCGATLPTHKPGCHDGPPRYR